MEYPARDVAVVWHNGGETELRAKTLTVDFSRSEPTQISVQLKDEDGDYAPGGTVGSTFRCNPTAASFAVQRYLTVEGSIGGQPLTDLPHFLQLDYEWDGRPEGSDTVIQGSDYAELLLTEDQVMADVTGSSAASAISEIALQYGLSAVDLGAFSDYTCAKYHRYGQPIEWIRDLLEIRQASWWIEGTTFKARNGGEWSPSSPVDWILRDRELLNGFKLRRSSAAISNYAHVIRVDSDTGRAYQFNGTANVGFYEFQLEFPCVVAVPTLRVQDGVGHTWVYYDENDNPLVSSGPVTGGIYIGPTPATKARLILEPVRDGITEVVIDLYVRGTRVPTAGLTFDPVYDAEYVDVSDQAIHGVRPFRGSLVRTQLADQATAQDFVTRFVREGLRGAILGQATTPLNPLLRPGHTVSVTCRQANLTNYRMAVESARWLVDFETGRSTMDLELTRTEAD